MPLYMSIAQFIDMLTTVHYSKPTVVRASWMSVYTPMAQIYIHLP